MPQTVCTEARRVRITVRSAEEITRFTRTTRRTLQRELKLLWCDYPNAKSIEVEVIE